MWAPSLCQFVNRFIVFHFLFLLDNNFSFRFQNYELWFLSNIFTVRVLLVTLHVYKSTCCYFYLKYVNTSFTPAWRFLHHIQSITCLSFSSSVWYEQMIDRSLGYAARGGDVLPNLTHPPRLPLPLPLLFLRLAHSFFPFTSDTQLVSFLLREFFNLTTDSMMYRTHTPISSSDDRWIYGGFRLPSCCVALTRENQDTQSDISQQ